MKIQKTKKGLQILNQALSQFKNSKGIKFIYAITKNKNLLKPEMAILDEIVKEIQTDSEYVEYEKKRYELCTELSKKDDKGNPVQVNNSFDIENKDEFEKRFSELKEEYQNTLDKQEDRKKEYESLLDEEITIDLHGIKFEDLPEDITQHQMESIFDLIVEDGAVPGKVVDIKDEKK